MGFLEKLRNLPEKKKKIILWAVVVILALFLFVWYFQAARIAIQGHKASKILEQELKIPGLQEKVGDMFKQVEPEKKKIEKAKDALKGLIEEGEKRAESKRENQR